MRKLILISAFALASVSASVSAQAGDRNLTLAANDTPATAPAEAKPEAATTDTARPESTRKQASKSRGQTHARHSYEGDEAKARRIAARYGVYW